MKKLIFIFIVFVFFGACRDQEKPLTADEIITKTIAVSGGDFFDGNTISFDFRGVKYHSKRNKGLYQLERITADSANIIRDVVSNKGFSRYVNKIPTAVPDTMVSRYSNSVNSVHYFAYLPYGLHDAAVRKELLDDVVIKGKNYYKIKVTFNQNGGGDDFEDVYIYWIDKASFHMDYLAYEFHVNGGGMRFREAYNIRNVNGIRFVDYKNFKPKNKEIRIEELDRLYREQDLEFLSTIALENIAVTPLSNVDQR